MEGRQDTASLTLQTRRVGGLPLINHILLRLKVHPLLSQALASGGRLSHAQALGVLLRNIVLNDRQPIYTHAEWAARAEPALIGLEEGQGRCSTTTGWVEPWTASSTPTGRPC